MIASPANAAAFAALQQALPPLPADAELILRPGAGGPTATVRADGVPPRVFTLADDGLVELQPGADAALPGAALLADPVALASVLAPVAGKLLGARLVAWRPGRRAVVRIDTADRVLWLKLLDAKSWRRAAAAFAALGDPIHPVRFARPEALLPEHCGYLAPDAPGTPLRTLLARGGVAMTQLVRGVLAVAYTQVCGELPAATFATAAAAAAGSLEQGSALRPELAGLAVRLAALPPPAPAATGFVHGDLHDKQVFVGPAGLCLIDLEGIRVGDARFDVANLAEHLRLRELQAGAPDSGTADQFLARCGLAPDAPATRAWRAVVRARLCGVYALRPRRRALVDRLHADTVALLEARP